MAGSYTEKTRSVEPPLPCPGLAYTVSLNVRRASSSVKVFVPGMVPPRV